MIKTAPASARSGAGVKVWDWRLGRRVACGWPGLLFALALIPRLWGIDWQLPSSLYFDETKHVSWAAAQADGRALSRTDFRNPSFYRRLLALEYGLAARFQDVDDDQEVGVFRLLLARVTSAVLGAGAVALTAMATARLFSGPIGGVAGLVLGLSLLHVNLSHLAVNDAPASFFLGGGLLFGVRALVAPRPYEFLLAGVFAGLAAAAKYNFGAIVLLPMAAVGALSFMSRSSKDWHRPERYAAVRAEAWLRTPALRVDSARAGVRSQASAPTNGDEPTISRVSSFGTGVRYVGLTVVGAVVGLIVGMPELLWAPGAVWQGIVEQARIGGEPQIGQPAGPVAWLYLEALSQGLGPAAVGAALVGLGWLVVARPRHAAALLAAPAACLAVMFRNEFFAARFAGPLLPFVALFAATGVAWLASRPLAPRWRAITLALAVGAIALPSTLAVVQHSHLATTTDSRVLAENWVRRQGERVGFAAQTFSLPAAWGGSQRLRGYRVKRFESLRDPDALARLACDGTRYVLVAAFTTEREPKTSSGATGYDRLASEARLVETFSPFLDGRSAPMDPDNMAIPFWNLDAFARPGTLIEVYQLPEDGRTLCRR